MSGGGSAPTPDPQVGEAAKMAAQTGADTLDFMKSQAAITNKWAAEDRSRYTSVFQPLQDAYIEKANNWDSAGRLSQVASEAKADVMSNAAQAQAQNARQMSAMGVNPNSGRFSGQARSTALATGLAAAGAQNNARSQARNEASAMQTNAINMGSGLAVNPLTSLQTSNNAVSSGAQSAQQGYSTQGNLLNQQYQNQLAQYQANQQASSSLWGGIGSLAGTAIGSEAGQAALTSLFALSDEDVKEHKAPVTGVLDAVKNMRVEKWQYQPGVEDNGENTHVGTYAQDFQRETGLGDGKSIGIMDAIGVLYGAVKELANEVDDLKEVA